MVENRLTTEKNGFTLIEILIVITIVALLGSALLTTGGIQAQLAKARDGKRKSDFKKMQNLLEDYYNDKSQYPQTEQVSCGATLSPYIGRIPCDPQSGKEYLYMACENEQGYVFFTNLEYERDPSIEEGGCKDGCGVGAIGTYNFGVASPNISLTDLSSCLSPESKCKERGCALDAEPPEEYCTHPIPGVCCDGGEEWILVCNGEAKCCPYLSE